MTLNIINICIQFIFYQSNILVNRNINIKNWRLTKHSLKATPFYLGLKVLYKKIKTTISKH